MSTTILGTWALVPLEKLVAESDLIIVGTLYDATENDAGIGAGYIQVDEIVFGNVRTQSKLPLQLGDSVKIEWADNWACASGMHMGRRGKKGAWLLEVEPNGTVSAGYPGRFTTDEKQLNSIRNLVAKRKHGLNVEVSIRRDVKGLSPRYAEAKQFVVPFDESELPRAFARASLTFFLAFGLFFILYRKRFGI